MDIIDLDNVPDNKPTNVKQSKPSSALTICNKTNTSHVRLVVNKCCKCGVEVYFVVIISKYEEYLACTIATCGRCDKDSFWFLNYQNAWNVYINNVFGK